MVPGHGGKSRLGLRPEFIELGFNVGVFHPGCETSNPDPETSGGEVVVEAGAEEVCLGVEIDIGER